MKKITKRLISSVLAAATVITSCLAGSASVVWAAETVQISSADDLYTFASRVNAGETALNAVLANDITVNTGTIDANTTSAKAWTPIGSSDYKYAGSFDGQGHTVSGLYYSGTSSYAGLFKYVGSGGEVKNTTLANSYMKASIDASGICGFNLGTISNCTNMAAVSASSQEAGGICGFNRGTISSCTNMGAVSVGAVSGSSYGYGGGICAYNNGGTISSCANIGTVTTTSINTGGICGYNGSSGTVSNCSNTGAVKGGSGSAGIGSAVGKNDGSTVSDCFYLSGTASAGIGSGDGEAAERTADQYKSGEVCYQLNGLVSGGETWYQTLDKDDCPVPDSTHGRVYISGVQYCPDKIESTRYSNTEGDYQIISDKHDYVNGFCSQCGGRQPATYNAAAKSYEIGNYGQLLDFADIVNNGNTSANGTLTADITVNEGTIDASSTSAEVWTPIGNESCNYAGSFDGQGHTVSGLYFNDTSKSYVGLFGYIKIGAEIKNTRLTNSYINANENVGGISGYSSGASISGCTNTATVCGVKYVGGISGYNGSTISGCINEGAISGSNQYIGGISGHNNTGTISGCSNTGNVSGGSISSTVGGISGGNNGGLSGGGVISSCGNTGTVSGNNTVGGISGYNMANATISNCSNAGAVKGEKIVGSICGSNLHTISSCCYLSGTASAGIASGGGEAEEKTADQYKSGEVCYLLNGFASGGKIWYQTLGTDAYPVPDSTHKEVYAVIVRHCSDSWDISYNNTSGSDTGTDKHTFGDDGICDYCGAVKGDADNSKTLDNADAAAILKYSSGIIAKDEFANNYKSALADYNGDGDVDIRDAIAVLKAVG